MSTKDMNYKRLCPICGDTLVGTDDGELVYEGLQDAVEQIDAGATFSPNCGLCGEEVTFERAKEIVAKGCPPLLNADGEEVLSS